MTAIVFHDFAPWLSMIAFGLHDFPKMRGDPVRRPPYSSAYNCRLVVGYVLNRQRRYHWRGIFGLEDEDDEDKRDNSA